MCGRYFIELDESKIALKIKEKLIKQNSFEYASSEVFPSQNAIVFIPKNNGVDVVVKKWGIKGRSLLINARIESLNERVTYKKILHQRCAVIANGFYEWNQKKKIYITKENEPFIYFAAIYNNDQEFVILTGESENQMKKIHPRTPIIMNEQQMKDYLQFKIEPRVNNENLHFELCE